MKKTLAVLDFIKKKIAKRFIFKCLHGMLLMMPDIVASGEVFQN